MPETRRTVDVTGGRGVDRHGASIIIVAAARIGEATETAPHGGGQLHLHAVVQRHPVIAGFGDFVGVRKRRGKSRALARRNAGSAPRMGMIAKFSP